MADSMLFHNLWVRHEDSVSETLIYSQRGKQKWIIYH